MPEPVEDEVTLASGNCPNCGAVVGPGSAACPACGFELGQPAAGPSPGFEDADTFEDEELEGQRPAVEVRRCPRCGDIVDDSQERCRRCGLQLRAPAPAAAPPPTAPDMAEEERPAPPPARAPPAPGPAVPGGRPALAAPPPAAGAPKGPGIFGSSPARPAAPPKPSLKSLPPEVRRALREKFMVKGSQLLVGLGIADAIVWAVPILWMNLWVNLGMCLANLVVIGWVMAKAQPHLDAGRPEMSDYEKKRVKNVLMGLGIILIVPIHEVLNIFPLGYYSPSWSSYGPAGLVNPVIMLFGAMIAAFNIQQSREKMGYFAVWRNGALILVLAPVLSLVQVGLPILVYPEWFNETIGLLGGTVMGIAFVLKNQRDKQFAELDNAMRLGEELEARGQLEQAITAYDGAINSAHTLFSHLIFNPDSPYVAVRVPPAYSEPWFRKGRVLARLRKHKKALAIFDMIIEMDPNNQIALLNEAEIMTDMGEYAGATRAVERVLKLVPEHPDALRMRATIAVAARKAAEEAERSEAAETVFNTGPKAPPPAPGPEGEFTDA